MVNLSVEQDCSEEMEIGPWRVRYQYVCLPKNAIKTPLIILGNSFFEFANLSPLFGEMALDFPVYIVNLPGMGSNSIENSSFDYSDYACMLKEFVNKLGINSTNILGLSESSFVAYTFASFFPERVGRLILGGVTHKLRDSIRFLLDESLESLNSFKSREFCANMAYTLVNLSNKKFTLTNSEDTYISVYRRFQESSAKDKSNIKSALQRMSRVRELSKVPMCESLFIIGEHDHFITPYESHTVHDKFKDSKFAMLKSCDHMIKKEAMLEIASLCERFLKGQSLKVSKKVSTLDSKSFPYEKIRQSSRFEVDWKGELVLDSGEKYKSELIDLNIYGCRVKVSASGELNCHSKFKLRIPQICSDIDIVLFRSQEEGVYRGTFSIKDISQLVRLQESLAMEKPLSKGILAA